MTTSSLSTSAGVGQAELDAARLMLNRMGISPADLLHGSTPASSPTFSAYIPIVAHAVSDATRRVYGSYWNRIIDQWGHRRLDEPTPTDIEQLVEHVKTHVVSRRNARG